MINTTIGKYKITRPIGEGGMASVYEAVHEMLGTKVAIKVLNPILSANNQIRERFRNEAKLMASLDHPNITKVIDFDEQPHQLSIVMEFLNGEDLNNKIKKNGPLSDTEIFSIFSQTLSAFEFAHENGIVHRDIKPSNIFILPNGHVKILDFGIAKLFGQGNEMTSTGTQLGTPIYMSPEQVKADKSIDHRSDIYSLGVTMFFAINGKPPYNSNTDSQFDIFTKIVYEPLPNFNFHSKYIDIVLTACKKNREERFQNCNEYLTILRSINNSKLNDKTLFDLEEKSENSQSSSTSKQSENIKNKSELTFSQANETKKYKNLIIGSVVFIMFFGIYYAFFNSSDEEMKENIVKREIPETDMNKKKAEAERLKNQYRTLCEQLKTICSNTIYEKDTTKFKENYKEVMKKLMIIWDKWSDTGFRQQKEECDCN